MTIGAAMSRKACGPTCSRFVESRATSRSTAPDGAGELISFLGGGSPLRNLLAGLLRLVFQAHTPLPSTRAQDAPAAPDHGCGSGTPFTRTTMYFGLAKPAGVISEGQWAKFLKEK